MRRFYCPQCDQDLTCMDGKLVKMRGMLSAPHFTVVTTFYLPAELGVYGATVEGEIELREGARIDFQCTNDACRHSFTAPYDDDLSEIKMIEEDGREEVVVFNRIYGRQSTFVVDYKQKKVIMAFGQDKDLYADEFEKPINYFGE